MAHFIDQLERLVGMGIVPIVGILLLFVLALAGAFVTFAIFGFKFFLAERRRHDNLLQQRDKERSADRVALENRLTQSETKHETCEKDRDAIRSELATLTERVTRLATCPKRDCPNRLPG